MRATANFVSILLALLVSTSVAHASPPTAAELEGSAASAAQRGDLGAAIDAWRRAAAAHAEAGDAAGELRATLRRGELERDRGDSRAALETLNHAVDLAEASGGAAGEAAARGALGAALVRTGDLQEGLEELARASALAEGANAPTVGAAIANETGSAHEALGQIDAALAAYGEAAAAEDPQLRHRALVNRAALAARELPLDEAERAIARARRAGEALSDAGTPAAHTRLAGAAHALARRSAGEARTALLESARADATRALRLAAARDDEGAATWAHGMAARIALAAGDTIAAREAAQAALRSARRARSSEAELAWHALLGRMARAEGDRDTALAHFDQAAELLVMRRASTGHGVRDGEVDAEIYLEVVDLLLARAPEHENASAALVDRVRARALMERFKAAELRDYFRDGCVDAYREKLRDPSSVSSTAAVIYPIPLADRLELLVSHAGAIAQFTVPVSRDELEATARHFGRQVRNRGDFEFKRTGQRLHAWLLNPIATHLEALGVTTLVFVPGGALRTIPMAALHDGDTFLVERYALATTPGLELTDPRPLDRDGLSAFLGGVSEGVQGFAPLAHVPRELESVRARTGGVVLLDDQFTVPKVRSELEGEEFTVVHVATHAQFGDSPEETFLLTSDGRISMDELAAAVGAFRYRDTPLELIMLSACETAAGDERAALGLAGVAVKSGARSAVGTLWAVNDEATAIVVEEFYDALGDPALSRAESLRRAQRKLLADVRYRHPGYWAPFLLISNWL